LASELRFSCPSRIELNLALDAAYKNLLWVQLKVTIDIFRYNL
jgi:hypothetical protein